MFNYNKLCWHVWTIFIGYCMYSCEGNAKNLGNIMRPKCGSVFLTVSSLKGSNLELNWENSCAENDEQPEIIALFNADVRTASKDHIIKYEQINAKNYPKGYYKTNVTFALSNFPGNWDYNSYDEKILGPHNLPYWIASFGSENQIIDTKPLRIQPSWMFDYREKIGDKRIGNLLIPGTHNSACYKGGQNLLFEDYLLTQDHSIWNQLVFGIRYFDIRVGYYINQGFFINHDFMRIREIKPVLEQFKRFVQASPGEIILIDFHRFPFPTNWGHAIHTEFINLLQNEIGRYAYFQNTSVDEKGPTLNEIWSAKKNIIFTYAEARYSKWHLWLWPPLPQAWADTTNQVKLKKFLEQFLSNKTQKVTMFDALMAELTPKPLDVLLGKNKLRKLASEVNVNLTKWVRDEWYNVNIVASDFFLGNDIINVAIDINSSD